MCIFLPVYNVLIVLTLPLIKVTDQWERVIFLALGFGSGSNRCISRNGAMKC